MPTRLALLATLVFMLLTASAPAATVSQETGPAYVDDGSEDGFGGCSRYSQCGTLRTIRVVAAPGETNSIAVDLVSASEPFGPAVIRERTGAQLTAAPGSNCANSSVSEVTCGPPLPPFFGQEGATLANAVVVLGDGDDSVSSTALSLIAFGEAGDDILNAGSAPSQLYGDDGSDTLHGGSAADRLYGGNSRDRIFGADGDDLLSGGEGDDDLFGQLGNDEARGGGGRDIADGGAGNDLLNGGKGRDALRGRAGADRVSSRDKERDRVSCGSGRSRDRATVDRRDKVSGCERRSVK